MVCRLAALVGLCLLACAGAPARPVAAPREPTGDTPASDAKEAPTPSAVDADLDWAAHPRLDFQRGDPKLPVRLMEGQTEIAFSSSGRLRIYLRGDVDKTVDGAPGSRWSVRVRGSEPARWSTRIILGTLSYADKSGVAAEQQAWQERGVSVRLRTIGTVYGIRGHVIDNRRYLLLLDEQLQAEQVPERQHSLEREFGIATSTTEDIERQASGSLELFDGDGNLVAISKDRLTAQPVDANSIVVRRVEFGVGYDFHGFEDRNYRGSLEVAVDRRGRLAAVNLISLEELLKGLVPAEMFARAPIEALKAQAVTARGEVLAKIGTKHIGDGYLLCSEQHCAVYKGLSGEAESSSTAVDATRGEALFSSDHRLVDSVYSAVCGGHTENNEAVWAGPASPYLRGRPDVLDREPAPPPSRNVAAFLSSDTPAACRLASLAQPGKYRWERRFSPEEVDRLTSTLGIGAFKTVTVLERGVSGRSRSIEISGSLGTVQVRGELNIRKLFGMLNSSLFLIDIERSPTGALQALIFRGGGWGHGVGMCQLGAIGRAERGQDYKAILRHYFNGAEVFRLY